MSATLTPDEIAAFCDAVERRCLAQYPTTERVAHIADINTIAALLPKIRAIAAPAAVPVSELQKLCNEWRNACDPEDFIHAGEDCDTCACREMLEGVIEGTYEFEELPPLPGAEGGAP